jgi:DNA-binding transcriptional LysR family regulator
MGVSQLPEFYVRPHLGTELVELLPEFRIPDEPIWGAYSRRRHLTPKLKQMLSMLTNNLSLALETTDRSYTRN